MTITENFDAWWREVGQFIPPCDTMSNADREVFKQFARGIAETSARDLSDLESQNSNLQEKIEELGKSIESQKKSVLEIVNHNNISTFIKIENIKRLYETQ